MSSQSSFQSSFQLNRHLVRPSPHVPWDVSVTHVIPAILLDDIISKQKMAAYDSYRSIQAIMSSNGKISLVKHQGGAGTGAGGGATIYQTLYHPLLNRSESLLLSMSGNDDSYFIYALNATTGFLAAWWLPHNATPSMLAKTPSCKLRLPSTVVSTSIVLLKAVGSRLFMASATGQLWCTTISARPMVLTATEWTRTGTSLWNRVFSTGSSSSSALHSPMVAFLPATDKDNNSFYYSISQSGCIDAWHTDAGRSVCRLQDLLQDEVEDTFDGIEVLQASSATSPIAENYGTMDIIVKLLRRRRARMYYVRYADEKLQHCLWLNRFPDSVPCHGIISCDNGMAYACFGSAPVTVLALGSIGAKSPTSMIHEIDLPLDEASNIIGMGKDLETHGVAVLTTQGLFIRARWMQLQVAVASPSDEEAHVLARHLLVAFWNYYQMKTVPLPPSLTATTSTPNMEAAILVTARQLQREGDGSSSHNCMEWHFAFLRLLKEAGLYKNLSSSGRWTLLGIGQELAIHSILAHCHLFAKELPPYGLAAKMAQVQQHVLNHSPTTEWSIALQKVLRTAMNYRNDHAIATYDVLTDPRHLWTHELRDSLLLQLKHPESAKVETLDVVTAALQVHQEINSKTTILSSLCQLAIDKPNEYSLEPILTKWDDFGSFALVWFAQQGHHDKVLRYGKLLPDSFGQLVEKHSPQYSWVHELWQKDYGAASDALFRNATGQDLEDTEWHLSMAKLAAKVHNVAGQDANKKRRGEDSAANYRRKRIDNKLDLVKAQRALIYGEQVPLQAPEFLLKLALEKCDLEPDQIVHYAMMGLIIASAADNRDGISTVWSKVIAVDMVDKWSVWIKSTPPPSRGTLVEDTVFGQLWKLVQEQQPVEVQSSMQYDAGLEDMVLRKLTSLDRGAARELKRLLSRTTSVDLSQSVVAGKMDEQ
ncbi:hypothetical protein MHU86_8095 [Fragilaria crotonensis]|nr:hypothetical protein MHU86_8095 [Fragilaria crotonensis]